MGIEDHNYQNKTVVWDRLIFVMVILILERLYNARSLQRKIKSYIILSHYFVAPVICTDQPTVIVVIANGLPKWHQAISKHHIDLTVIMM